MHATRLQHGGWTYSLTDTFKDVQALRSLLEIAMQEFHEHE